VDVVEFGSLTPQLRGELEGDEVDPFDGAGSTLQWRPKDRHVGLRGPDGRLLASTGLVQAGLEAGDGLVTEVVGIGGVIVAAAFRGQGLGSRVIVEALRVAAGFGPPAVILFCHRNRVGLYVRHGFLELAPPVLVSQPDGFAEIPLVTMWRALRDGVDPPQGPIRVLSLPF
jgi:predicted GNAT family N-acyltransferase